MKQEQQDPFKAFNLALDILLEAGINQALKSTLIMT